MHLPKTTKGPPRRCFYRDVRWTAYLVGVSPMVSSPLRSCNVVEASCANLASPGLVPRSPSLWRQHSCKKVHGLLSVKLLGDGGGSRLAGYGTDEPTIGNSPAENDILHFELWHACAGPNINVEDKVEAYMKQDGTMEMPIYNLPPKILCRVVNVQLQCW